MAEGCLFGGIDEAGYGPTLGPLVVTAALFRAGTWDRLGRALAAAANPAARLDAALVRVADSKLVYRSGSGFPQLEKTALAFVAAAAGRIPGSVRDLLHGAGEDAAGIPACPWYGPAPLDHPLPLSVSPALVGRCADAIRKAMAENDASFLGFATRVVLEPEFNAAVQATANKAVLLADVVTRLVAKAASAAAAGGGELVVDKLGGRNFYAHLLAGRFPLARLRVLAEGRAASAYEIAAGAGRLTVRFMKQADRSQPAVSLASMFSKYVREIFMRMFNAYWRGLGPPVRPTAGYYCDACRFLEETKEPARRAGIDLAAMVRLR